MFYTVFAVGASLANKSHGRTCLLWDSGLVMGDHGCDAISLSIDGWYVMMLISIDCCINTMFTSSLSEFAILMNRFSQLTCQNIEFKFEIS